MVSDKEIETMREKGMVSRCCKKDVIFVNGSSVQHYCCTKCSKPCELTAPQEAGTVNVVPAEEKIEDSIPPEGLLYFYLGGLRANLESINNKIYANDIKSVIEHTEAALHLMQKCERIIYGSGTEEICTNQEQEKHQCIEAE